MQSLLEERCERFLSASATSLTIKRAQMMSSDQMNNLQVGKIRCHGYRPWCLAHLEQRAQGTQKILFASGCQKFALLGSLFAQNESPAAGRFARMCSHSEPCWNSFIHTKSSSFSAEGALSKRGIRCSYFGKRVPGICCTNPSIFSIFRQCSCSELEPKASIFIKSQKERGSVRAT